MRLLGLIIWMFFVLPASAWSLTPDDFQRLTLAEQVHKLEEIGCHEGGEVGDFEALKAITYTLNKKYRDLESFVGFSSAELDLVWQLTRANGCVGYYSNEKQFFLTGCEIALMLADHIEPERGFEATYPCYDKHPDYSVEEKQKTIETASRAVERIAERATKLGDERKNFYRFMFGRYLCLTNTDCEQGLATMYTAALAEYQEKGVAQFDKEIVDNLSTLYKSAFERKNPDIYRFVTDLEIALQEQRGIQIYADLDDAKKIYRNVLTRWAAEGITTASAPKPLTVIVSMAAASTQVVKSELEAAPMAVPSAAMSPTTENTPASSTPWGAVAMVVFVLATIGVGALLLRRRKGSSS